MTLIRADPQPTQLVVVHEPWVCTRHTDPLRIAIPPAGIPRKGLDKVRTLFGTHNLVAALEVRRLICHADFRVCA